MRTKSGIVRISMNRTFILSVVLFAVLMAQGFAQSIVLICDKELKLTLDEAAGTARLSDGDSAAASFTDSQVTWKSEENYGGFVNHNEYTLSRISGTLTVHTQCIVTRKGYGCRPYSTSDFQCEVRQNKF